MNNTIQDIIEQVIGKNKKSSNLNGVSVKYETNLDQRPVTKYKHFDSEKSARQWIDNQDDINVVDIIKEQYVDVFEDVDTGEQYYINLCEETLEERKIIIRVNSKGIKTKKIRCPAGRVVKTVNGRQVCVTPTGRERLTKRIAIRKSVRTKKSKGAGYQKRVNFRRQRALKKRKQLGIKNQG